MTAKPAAAPAASTTTPPPLPYFEEEKLLLQKGSIDTVGAKKSGKKATVPGTQVSDLQRDLVTLGYLQSKDVDGIFGGGLTRALSRFQKHAQRSYRMKGETSDDEPKPVFAGRTDGVCEPATAAEVQRWVGKGWVLPLNRFPIVPIVGGKLRQDAAKQWVSAITYAESKGAQIPTRYGDTTRNVTAGFVTTGGNSRFSHHYTGRAVDLSQEEAGWVAAEKRQGRWFVVKESLGGNTYWRIWCRTKSQDGTQGTEINPATPGVTAKVTTKYYSFYEKKEKDVPTGHYVDLSSIFLQFSFDRIPAHGDWKTNPKGQEWWHFFYNVDLQPTFLDEMELRGVSEKVLRSAGWNSDKDLDRKPG